EDEGANQTILRVFSQKLSVERLKAGDHFVKVFEEVLMIRGSFTNFYHLDAFIFRSGANPRGHIGLSLRIVNQDIDVAGFKLIDKRSQISGCWLPVAQAGVAVTFGGQILHLGVREEVISNRLGLHVVFLPQLVQPRIQPRDLVDDFFIAGVGCWVDVIDVLCDLVGDFHHRGGVVPNVLVAIDGFDLVGVSLLAVVVLMSFVLVSLVLVSLVVVLVAMIMVVGGQRKRVDDLVLIVERRVKPSIISTAADHDDIC